MLEDFRLKVFMAVVQERSFTKAGMAYNSHLRTIHCTVCLKIIHDTAQSPCPCGYCAPVTSRIVPRADSAISADIFICDPRVFPVRFYRVPPCCRNTHTGFKHPFIWPAETGTFIKSSIIAFKIQTDKYRNRACAVCRKMKKHIEPMHLFPIKKHSYCLSYSQSIIYTFLFKCGKMKTFRICRHMSVHFLRKDFKDFRTSTILPLTLCPDPPAIIEHQRIRKFISRYLRLIIIGGKIILRMRNCRQQKHHCSNNQTLYRFHFSVVWLWSWASDGHSQNYIDSLNNQIVL